MQQNQTYLLEMKDICKEFPGVKALDNAQLKLRAGTVHALMGENGAGKSTLMKCLFGIYKKDAGTILMEGKEVNFINPRNALDNGVAMVHQELNQVLRRSVMENVWLGRFPMHGPLVDGKRMYNETKKVLNLSISTSIPSGSSATSPFRSGRWSRSPRRFPTMPRSSCSMSRLPL